MGAVKRVLITGASGFVGKATVQAAKAAGLGVVTVGRSNADVVLDLTSQGSEKTLIEALAGCDAVIHLAAAMSGDSEAHKRLTVGGTEMLLSAMAQAQVGHLTLASSIAVFDTGQVPIGAEINDACALENPAMSRDAYSGAKVRQEQLARSARLDSLAIIRPGIVFDEAHLWNAHLGVGVGPILVRVGQARDPLPMCHVSRCADALVQATVNRLSAASVVVDQALPTRGQVITAMMQNGWPKAVVPVPWQVMNLCAQMLRPFARRLPGLLRPDVLRQRALPIRYGFDDPFDGSLIPSPAIWGAAT